MILISCDIHDSALAGIGLARIEWALQDMPVLQFLMKRFSREKPLNGIRISGCLHITAETANLARVLVSGGADLILCASNLLSTQDDVAAALVKHFRIPVFARKGEDNQTYYQHINAVHPVPGVIDRKIARMKLEAMKIEIDTLAEEQERNLSSREEGT